MAHIEQGGIVELADGGTVGTLHVVGVDLEHRLGVHTGLAAGGEVLVGHLRRRLLGSVLHEHTAREGARRLVVEDVLVELAGRAVGHTVGDEGVVVDMLLLVGDDTAVALALGALAREGEVETVAGGAVVQGDDVMVHAAVGLLVDVDVAEAYILMMCLLHTIEVE